VDQGDVQTGKGSVMSAEMTATTDGHVPAENVLTAAFNADLKQVLVVGLHQDGSLYIACSDGHPEAIYLATIGAHRVMALATGE
jgi:hypothetical protein